MTEPSTTAPSGPAVDASVGPKAGGRRRIDRVLADDYLDGIVDLPLVDVRARRADAEQEEADLSYVRRLLQGRMDIVRAELSRRSDGGGQGSLVDQLASILADGPPAPPHGMGRHVTVEPSRVDEHRRAVEQLIADVGISDVVSLGDSDLADALARVEEYERAVSRHRRRVQEVMDSCTAEIARRYKSGEASVDDLLAGR
jgi:hypothetical protein